MIPVVWCGVVCLLLSFWGGRKVLGELARWAGRLPAGGRWSILGSSNTDLYDVVQAVRRKNFVAKKKKLCRGAPQQAKISGIGCTGLPHYPKILIQIALTSALKPERKYSDRNGIAIHNPH
jgi:hypothetical protein